MRLVAGKRHADLAWTEESVPNPLLWVWTVLEVSEAVGEKVETVLGACDLLSIVPRPVDDARPDLGLLSCWDVSRIVALLGSRPRRGARRKRVDMLVSKAMADGQLAAFTDMLEGLYRGPSSLEAATVESIVDPRRHLTNERLCDNIAQSRKGAKHNANHPGTTGGAEISDRGVGHAGDPRPDGERVAEGGVGQQGL
jgi:hypothetical protein